MNKRINIVLKAFMIGSLSAALITFILSRSTGIPFAEAARTTVGIGAGISAAVALNGFRKA